MNAQYWYAFHFNFVVAHYYGAVVFVASLVLHVIVKMPVIARAYRERGGCGRCATTCAHAARAVASDLVAPNPAAPTISRRGLFAFAGGASLLLLVANAGESIGGPLRAAGVPRAAPARTSRSTRPPRARGSRRRWSARRTGWRSAAARARSRSAATTCWRCRSTPRGCRSPASRAGRRRRTWTGVRLSELAALAGVPGARDRVRALAAAGGRAVEGVAERRRGRRPGRAARAEGQRRRPARWTTAIRRGSSSRRCRACTTPSGSRRSSSRRCSAAAAPARPPRAAAARARGRCSQVFERVEREGVDADRDLAGRRRDPARPRAAAAVRGRSTGWRSARCAARPSTTCGCRRGLSLLLLRRVLGHDRRQRRAAPIHARQRPLVRRLRRRAGCSSPPRCSRRPGVLYLVRRRICRTPIRVTRDIDATALRVDGDAVGLAHGREAAQAVRPRAVGQLDEPVGRRQRDPQRAG